MLHKVFNSYVLRQNGRFVLSLCMVVYVLGVTGCATTKDETLDWSAEKLYKTAKEQLDDEQYQHSISYYEKLQARYPYGIYAEQARIDMAYAYFKQHDTPSAVASCDLFLKLHPRDPRGAYVYYLKGMAYIDEDRNTLLKWAKQKQSERDAESLRLGLEAFRESVEKFPTSIYAADSYNKMLQITTELAAHEIFIAEFYYERGAYIAAANRAQGVIHDFPNSPAALEEALKMLIKSYDALKLPTLRDDAKRVLELNYPQS